MRKNHKNILPVPPELAYHKPVLVDEVIEYLVPSPRKIYLDVTFGTGGHTSAILDSEPKCSVIAMDWDHVALETYGAPLQEKYGDRLHLVWGNFSLLYKILKKEKIDKVDGILADFGTSQIQIMERAGFSIYRDTPLDMRMSPPHQAVTAEHVINKSSEQKLREIFWQLGEEPYAKEIARAILLERTRSKKRIKTTGQLADIVEKAVPFHRRKKIHPATRVFQALRIYVNHELENITSFLPAALNALNESGRLVCISFHSLEDRLVKNFFKDQSAAGNLDILTPKVVGPTKEEIKLNPSSRSAKLRAAQRV
jgi:16S rRNA (cytosine1402-N4)-methyltransferase